MIQRNHLRTAAIILLALPALVACGASGAGGSSEPVGADKAPRFIGPYAAEFAAFYGDARSEFARSVLADEQITDAEYAEMEEKFRKCLESEGITFDGFAPDGSYSTSSAPDGGDTYEIVTACSKASGADEIGALHDIMRLNPQNLDFPTLMSECLVGSGAVPAGYSAEDWLADAEGRFVDIATLPPAVRTALETCSADPLGTLDE